MALFSRHRVFGSSYPQFVAIITGIIGVILFITPLIIFPGTLEVWETTKAAWFILGVCIALIFGLWVAWRERRIPNILKKRDIVWLVFFILLLLATFLSVHPAASLFGLRGAQGESLIGYISLLLFMLLVRVFFRDHRILLVAFWLIMAAYTFAALFFLFGIFGFPIFGAFSTFPLLANSVTIVSITSALVLGAFLYLLLRSKSTWRMVLFAGSFVHILLLFIMDLNIAWYLLLLEIFCIFFLLTVRGKMHRNTFIVFVAAALLIFLALFFDLSAVTHATLVPDVLLGQNPSARIVWETIKKNPVSGSGPATFVYDYMKYAPAELYVASGGIEFLRAGSQLWQWIATLGLGGILLFGLAVSALVRVFAAIAPFSRKDDAAHALILDLFFLFLAGLLFVSVFFPLQFTLLMLWFFLFAATDVVLDHRSHRPPDTTIKGGDAMRFSFIGGALALVAFISIILTIRSWGAEAAFGSALRSASQVENFDTVEQQLERARRLAPWDATVLAALGEQQAIRGVLEKTTAAKADDVQRLFTEARRKDDLQPAIVSAQIRAHVLLGADTPYTIADIEDALKKRIEQEPGQAAHYLAYAQFALEVFELEGADPQNERLGQADQLLREAKTRNQYLPGVDFTQARMLSLQGKHDEAVTILKALVQLYPGVQDFRDALAQEYDLIGAQDKAAQVRAGQNPE